MFLGNWIRVSLARKLSLLFGTSILLILSATLVFPRLHMEALNEQAMLLQAKRIAAAAFQLVDSPLSNWSAENANVRERWPWVARELGLPLDPPMVIPLDAISGGVDTDGSAGGFLREAANHLIRDPEQRYYWRVQQEGRLFRFAMAIRSTAADAAPGLLRGLIDVRLPIAQDAGFWNVVATVLAGASGAMLSLVVLYMVADRQVLRPLTTLQQVAEQVAKGDMTAQVQLSSRDEFHDLAVAVNNMLSHLRAAQEEQQRINAALDARLGELTKANVALFEANRFKSEFLANVSHELRTPLVSIIGFAELLRDAWESAQADRSRMSRYSENILTSGRSLLELINDLLDLARIEAGRMQIHLSEFSITELCEDLIDFVRPLADGRRQSLVLSSVGPLPLCHTDSGKVKQILNNLLSNALKFTPEGGTIELMVGPGSEGFVHLAVRDDGPGIAPEHHDSIFEKFHQLDSSKTREHEGTGLGLAISKELARMLGGTVSVESKLSLGATFHVNLPTTRIAPA